MGSFFWYSDTPTVMSSGGTGTYIYPTDDMKAQLAKDAPEWVDRAEKDGTPITVVTRAAVESMLKDVDVKAITDARLDPDTTDVAEPALGTAKDKEDAVRAKMETVLSVSEWEKLSSLQASVVKEAPVNEKPIEDKPIAEVFDALL